MSFKPSGSSVSTKESVQACDLVARARSIGSRIFDRRFEAGQKRSLPKQTVEDLLDSKIIRACMPRKFGGYELPFGAHTDVAMELAKYCGSTAWVAGILGSHNWWLGKYQPEAQYEIWENNPDALVGSAFASTKGTHGYEKNGGYIVSGTWKWCSGVEYCEWVSLVTSIVMMNGETELTMVLLNKEEFKVDDVWHSPGLRATGSNNVMVDDIFVPSHRVTKLIDLNKKDSPGSVLNTSSVYKLPMLDVFSYTVAIPTLGSGIATLDFYLSEMHEHVALDNLKIAEFQSQQLRVAESSMELDAALQIYVSDLKLMWDAANADREIEQHEALKFKRNCAYVSTLAKRAAGRVIEAMGAGGISDNNPAYTAYSDTIAGAAHRALSWDINATLWGKKLFGINDEMNEIDKRKVHSANKNLD